MQITKEPNQFTKELGIYVIQRKKVSLLIDGIIWVGMAGERNGNCIYGRLRDHFAKKKKKMQMKVHISAKY